MSDEHHARDPAFLRYCQAITVPIDLGGLIRQALAGLHALTRCSLACITPSADFPGRTLNFANNPVGQDAAPLALPAGILTSNSSRRDSVLHDGRRWHGLHLSLAISGSSVGVLSLLTGNETEVATWDLPLLEVAARLLAQAIEIRLNRQALSELNRY